MFEGGYGVGSEGDPGESLVMVVVKISGLPASNGVVGGGERRGGGGRGRVDACMLLQVLKRFLLCKRIVFHCAEAKKSTGFVSMHANDSNSTFCCLGL